MAVDLSVFADIGKYEPWLHPLIARAVEAGILTGTRREDGKLYLDLDGPMPGWRVVALLGRLVDRDLLIRDQELAELRQRVARSVVAVGFTPDSVIGAGVVLQQPITGLPLVVTADHVVAAIVGDDPAHPKGYPVVTALDGASTWTKIIRRSPELDLAVLEAPHLKGHVEPAQVGSVPPVGAQVIAVGSPLGVKHHTTLGIVSNNTMKLEYYKTVQDVFPTDTPINPGNSGGGLFDMQGRLVGFTLAKFVHEAVEAFGFAEPAEAALRTLGVLV